MRLRTWVPTAAGVRGVLAGGAVVARGRARRDGLLLLAVHGTVALAALLAVAGPQLVERAFTLGVRGAVEQAGRATDVVVASSLRPSFEPSGAARRSTLVGADRLADVAAAVPAALPAVVRRVAGPLFTTVSSAPLTVDAAADRPAALLTLGFTAGPGSEVRHRDQDAATIAAAGPPAGEAVPVTAVPVTVSAELAQALHLAPGARLHAVPTAGAPVDLVVVGVHTVVTPDAVAWTPLPAVAVPRAARTPTGAPAVAATVLVPASALPIAAAATARGRGADAGIGLGVEIHQTLTPDRLRTDDVGALLAAVPRLDPVAAALPTPDDVPGLGPITVGSRLGDVLATYRARERAARAQLSLVVVGVVGAAAVVVVLWMQLLAGRRARDHALEHARGASITAVAARALLESLPLGLLAASTGAVAGRLLVPGDGWSPGPLLVVAAVAVLAPAGFAAHAARRGWTRRQPPADPGARARIRARQQLRRTVGEGALLVLVAAGVTSLRGRGLAQSQTGGVDLLLAAAPLLLVLGVTVVVLRGYPWPVRGLAALGRSRRGVVAAVSTARAERAVTVLPLLGLALAVGLVVSAGLLRDTVTGGQEAASWERVGADVRVEAPVDAGDLRALRAAPGVVAVAAGHVRRNVTAKFGNDYGNVTVIAVDGRELGALLAARPQGYRGELARLGAASPAGTLPAVVSPELAAKLGRQPLAMVLGPAYQRAEVVGTASVPPRGWEPGDVVFVDAAATARALPELGRPNLVWAVGPGADAAVRALPGVTDVQVRSRAGWLAATRGSALLAQVLLLLALAVGALGVFAALAMLGAVLVGARERAGELSTLRTLGLSAGQGRWLVVGELAPLVVAGAGAGASAGVVTVVGLGPALGLDALTGGLEAPALSLRPAFVAGVVGGLVLLFVLAALAEVAVHRRDRPAEVLRLGDVR